MKTRRKPTFLNRLPHAALTAILSLHLALPAWAVDPTAGTVLNGSYSLDGAGGTTSGNNAGGYFLQSGSLTLSNVTLQNFQTTGGAGSGGGAGMGGVLFINSGANVTLNNVNVLSNNVIGGQGGVGGTGGALNNLFLTGSTAASGANGTTPTNTNYTDIGGTTGSKGYNGSNSAVGFGGAGGNGGNGGNGGDRSDSLILGVTTASVDVVGVGIEVAAAAGNPFTVNVAVGLAPQVISAGINLGNAIAALVYFDKSLSDGQIGLGGTAGQGGNGGNSGFGFGGAAGGNGGNGGTGGSNWSGSAYKGGAAGGDAGSGGNGGMGGFGAGGGQGGNGGLGGGGAGWTASAATPGTPDVTETIVIPASYSTGYIDPITNQRVKLEGNLQSMPSSYLYDHDNNIGTPFVLVTGQEDSPAQSVTIIKTVGTPATVASQGGSRPDGLDGAAGGGGTGGFGAGAGASGTAPGSMVAGGSGGSGLGGAIFLRSGASLTITGNALFDGNGARGGNGQAGDINTLAGATGGAAGSDIFLMKGSSLILNPGAGNTITFNGDPSGSSIADDSAASGVDTSIRSGQGADVRILSGLVQFNGTNLYSGQTRIEGGTLQAQDGDGIYFDSNIHFLGSAATDGVLMSNGDFTRYVGIQSNRVQWTGSGGFAASGGELNVRLSNNQTMIWGSNAFVPAGSALIFGSATATDKVNFSNAINLNGGNRTILVTANEADASANLAANVDAVVMQGIISNGSLTIGDATHTGTVVLAAANTYTGPTTVVGGTLATLGDERINNASDVTVMTGATFSAGGNETIGAISGAGTFDMQAAGVLTTVVGADSVFSGAITGAGTLTKEGAAKLTLSGTSSTTGTLNLNAGSIDLTGSIESKTVNVAAGTDLNSTAGGLAATAEVTNAGTLNVGSANDTVAKLTNTGTVNGTSTLTAATYDLNNGSVVNANLGAGTLNTAGTVALNGTSAASAVNVATGSAVTLGSAERLLDTTTLSVSGSLTLGGNENVGTIAGGGTIAVGTSTLISNALVDTLFSGALTGTTGGFTKNGTGKLTLSGNSTYTGVTQINAGTVDLTGSLASNTVNVVAASTLNSTAGGLASTATVTNAGTLNVGATNDTITTLNNTGTINGTSTLTATTYNLNGGTVLNANLGAGTLNTTGLVTMNGSSLAAVVNVALGSTLDLMAPELLLNTASVTVDGILNLKGGDETINTLLGNGVVNTNAYKLIVANGGNFRGTLNAAQTNLDGGTGPLTLDGGTTTTNTTTVNNTLVITNGGVLNSTTISLANGSVLDLSGGGTINFTNLTSLGDPGGTINIGANDFIIPVGSVISGFIKFIGTGNVINNGTFAPGFSPGLIDLTGAGLAPAQLGGYQVELANLAGVGGTSFDQLRIAAGATLTIGGVLNVANFGGFTAAQGNTFQVISGPGGAVPINHLTGTFAGVTFDNDGIGVGAAAVTNAAVVFDVNTGMITTTGLNTATSTFADLGGNTNQRGAAAAIFAAANVGPTTMANQIDSSTTAGALALQLVDAIGSPGADLAKYVPEYYGSMADYAFMGDQVLFRSIQDRVSAMNYLPAEISAEDLPSQVPNHFSFFFGYMNSSMDTDDDASLRRNDYYIGSNVVATDKFVAGLAGSLSDGNVSAPLGNAEVEGFGVMIYARGTIFENFTVFGTAGYSSQDFDLTRSTVNGTVTGSTDAVSWTGVIGVQHKGWNWGDVSFSPRVSLAYSKTDVGGFSEAGAVDALALGAWSATRFVGEAGLSALWRTEIAGRPFAAELSASVQQAFVNSRDSMQANIITVPAASYPVNFSETEDTQAIIRANFNYDLARMVSLYTGYEGQFGGQTAHYIKGGLRVNF
ncbi:MAG: hypothetical protein ACO1TE_06815 [Prosthecobacter sp.]